MKAIKNFTLFVSFLFISIVSGQESTNNYVKKSQISITINSEKEFDKTFKFEDVEDIFDLSEEDQEIQIEINCNKNENLKSSIHYVLSGTKKTKNELKSKIEKIKLLISEFYNKN